MEETADEETKFYTGLRQLCIMRQHGVYFTKRGEIYSDTLPEDTNTVSQSDARLATLLRSKSVDVSLMNPLNRAGVKHMGELITADGTHLISIAYLERTYGSKITAREKRALNQFSVSISGVFPPKISTMGRVRSTQPLDRRYRALPPEYVQSPHNSHTRRATGSRDIRDLFTQPPIPTTRTDPPQTQAHTAQTPKHAADKSPRQARDHDLPAHIQQGDLTAFLVSCTRGKGQRTSETMSN